MNFEIGSAKALKLKDTEISELFYEVYVDSGFTDATKAKLSFEPFLVREKGLLLGAREVGSNQIAAMLILIPPSSSACRFAKEDEAEIHLLGVKPVYRRQGLGRALDISKATSKTLIH